MQLPLLSSLDLTRLAPGFSFHPTDEELVSYYLKWEVDVYGAELWELPLFSRLQSHDLEWCFFTSLGCKYSNCCRTNQEESISYLRHEENPSLLCRPGIAWSTNQLAHAQILFRGQRSYSLRDSVGTENKLFVELCFSLSLSLSTFLSIHPPNNIRA
ncbi:hypothetical protein IEQ34_022878 [Dendrobium chrysotoxum]|uniref:NAC domain-containing protein n=1 Tax=Dendrobium chrysotoxum TaxID=161865 RepID=A0AAV7G0A6_DENCH|nr:hypothetical protein IEQ34_022878 [Dendrobium chrysotoxum]